VGSQARRLLTMTTIAHDRPDGVLDGVVRITAANPGVMTGPGTNTYLVGSGEVAVIDPGPEDADHVEAVLSAVEGTLRWILVTHTHPDHAPGAERLAALSGAERPGFASRDGFDADRTLEHGSRLSGPGYTIEAVHTPGHASNHLCYALDRDPPADGKRARVLFSGDHVMEGSTVVISPPDGDMVDYLTSLRMVRDLVPRIDVIAPGHGQLIHDPAAAVDRYLDHRAERERTVLSALTRSGTATVDDLLAEVYADVDEARHPIARRSLWAHLRALAATGQAWGDDPDDPDTAWRTASTS